MAIQAARCVAAILAGAWLYEYALLNRLCHSLAGTPALWVNKLIDALPTHAETQCSRSLALARADRVHGLASTRFIVRRAARLRMSLCRIPSLRQASRKALYSARRSQKLSCW